MPASITVNDCDAVTCGFRCLRACPTGALLAVPKGQLTDPPSAPAGYNVALRFEGSCNACGLCAQACPEGAIVTEGAPGAGA